MINLALWKGTNMCEWLLLRTPPCSQQEVQPHFSRGAELGEKDCPFLPLFLLRSQMTREPYPCSAWSVSGAQGSVKRGGEPVRRGNGKIPSTESFLLVLIQGNKTEQNQTTCMNLWSGTICRNAHTNWCSLRPSLPLFSSYAAYLSFIFDS